MVIDWAASGPPDLSLEAWDPSHNLVCNHASRCVLAHQRVNSFTAQALRLDALSGFTPTSPAPSLLLDASPPALRLHAKDPDAAASEAQPRRRVPAESIDAYWLEVGGRAEYVISLLGAGRYSEALTLCATYLESVTHALVVTDPRVGESETDQAAAEEDDPYLGLIHPQQLARLVTHLPGVSTATSAGFAILFDTGETRLLYKDQALDIIRSTLPMAEAALVERVLWKCTVAYIVYDFLRSQSYRRREGTRIIGLGSAFYEGESIHGLGVPELVALLRDMIEEACTRSHATGLLPEPA